jgi:hypothetical protein
MAKQPTEPAKVAMTLDTEQVDALIARVNAARHDPGLR